jgi:DNA polymerase-3 subunit gamma/tau
MAYQTLYRAWRPRNFDELLGQDHIARTLKNAISSGRLAHAYLFCGPRGTGKTSTAKILAKALNCQHGPTPEPCDNCSLCLRIREGYCLDVLEMDAASNRGIDEIRSLRDQVRLSPTEARYKVYIIDEVHMLTAEAFNAFLKTLEEPPARVVFVLATTEPERLPATILSRCQRFDFHRLTEELIAQRLQAVAAAEKLALEARTVLLLARSAEGSMRDGLGLLDQCISFCGTELEHNLVLDLLGIPASEVLTALLEAVGEGDAGAVLEQLARLRAQGKDPRLLQKHLTYWFRNLLLLKVCREPGPLLPLSPEELKGLEVQTGIWSKSRLAAALTELTEQEGLLRFAAQPWIVLETALVGLALPPPTPTDGQKVTPAPAQTPPLPGAKPKPVSAPAAKSATRPAQPLPGGDLTRVQSCWDQILNALRAQGPALEALWRYGRPQSIEGNILNVVFETEGIMRAADRPDKTGALEQALQGVLEMPLQVRLQVAVPTAPATAGPSPAVEPPGVAEAKKLFGVDKVVIRPESEE